MNQDGRTATVTSPSVDAQEKLIRECYAHAGLDLGSTAFVEGHLTGMSLSMRVISSSKLKADRDRQSPPGTSVGDPVEAEAIARTFGRSRLPGSPPVLVGSVKANLGHTEAASGLASLVKAIYMLKERVIPPQILFEKPNPNIPLEKWNLKASQVNSCYWAVHHSEAAHSLESWLTLSQFMSRCLFLLLRGPRDFHSAYQSTTSVM